MDTSGSRWGLSVGVLALLAAVICGHPRAALAAPINNNITINSATVKVIHADDLLFIEPAVDLLEVEIDFTNTEKVTGSPAACDLDDNPSIGATDSGGPWAFSVRVKAGDCQSVSAAAVDFPVSSIQKAKGKTFAIFRGAAVSGEPVDLRIDTLSGETRQICGQWMVTAVIGTVDLSTITANPISVEITTDTVDDLGCVEGVTAEID